MIDIYH